jgi:DNA-binding transcriptional LysR family regulator
MEMHQIRYFLGVARTLNFTRAAEECHVSQPSLTRAIKLLEEELGGDLFRRERNLSHLTELGQRMLPLMQQCYESAVGAKSLASSIRKGEIATLRIALSLTIELGLFIPLLTELMRAVNGLELKFLRGTADEIAERLKQGDADLAIAGALAASWDRFDAKALFTEPFVLFTHGQHRLAAASVVEIGDIVQERLLVRSYCEQSEQLAAHLRDRDVKPAVGHHVASERDLGALLDSNFGIAIAPRSTGVSSTTRRVPINGLEMSRTVFVYTVAGRPHSPPADILLRQLRAANWPDTEPARV